MSDSPDPLAPLFNLPGVSEACEKAREALAAVHRHPANRRGWATTAAESALRGARSSAGVEGASVRLEGAQSGGGTDGADLDPVLAGALRVSGELHGEALPRLLGVWERSPLQALAHLHVLAASAPGAELSALGRPRSDQGVAERLQGLAQLLTGATAAPAPILAAVVHGEIASLQPFGSADGVVARAASRLVSISRGLDPHGLGVPEVSWYRDRAGYTAALAGFASGNSEGVGRWLCYCAAALEAGAREAGSIADAAGG